MVDRSASSEPDDRLPDRPGRDDPGRGRRLGIDVGTVRIGVATSDPDGILATPVETVRRDRTDRQHLRRLAQLVDEFGVVEVVVGLPRTLADRTGPSALDAIAVADALAARIAPTPVRLVDERLTTVDRAAVAARGRGPGQGTAGDDRSGRRGRHPAVLAGPAARGAAGRGREQQAGEMADDLGREERRGAEPPRAAPAASAVRVVNEPRRARARPAHKRRRRWSAGFSLVLLVVVVVGAVFLGSRLWHRLFGPATTSPVEASRTSSSRCTTATPPRRSDRLCTTTKWSRPSKAFVDAAAGNAAISAIQPGFYKVRTEIPGVGCRCATCRSA